MSSASLRFGSAHCTPTSLAPSTLLLLDLLLLQRADGSVSYHSKQQLPRNTKKREIEVPVKSVESEVASVSHSKRIEKQRREPKQTESAKANSSPPLSQLSVKHNGGSTHLSADEEAVIASLKAEPLYSYHSRPRLAQHPPPTPTHASLGDTRGAQPDDDFYSPSSTSALAEDTKASDKVCMCTYVSYCCKQAPTDTPYVPPFFSTPSPLLRTMTGVGTRAEKMLEAKVAVKRNPHS